MVRLLTATAMLKMMRLRLLHLAVTPFPQQGSTLPSSY
jgi:hypothetical protein